MDNSFRLEWVDNLSGRVLRILFPQSDLDWKAIKTIRADPPPFLVPFQYRLIDGSVEISYQLGTLNKIVYFGGVKSRGAYLDFWEAVLAPLIGCEDWFLVYQSFLLDVDYLFVNNEQPAGNLRYIYIPSRTPCSDSIALKELVGSLSQKIRTNDPALELDVVRSIQAFNAYDFFRLIKQRQGGQPSTPQNPPTPQAAQPPVPGPTPQPAPAPAPQQQVPAPVSAPEAPEPLPTPRGMDDISISLHTQPKQKGKQKPKKEKKEKVKVPKEKKPGLFSRKSKPQVILEGAAANHPHGIPAGYSSPAAPPPAAQPIPATPSYAAEEDDVTMIIEQQPRSDAPSLRLVSGAQLPHYIQLDFGPDAMFTIGRFDITVGTKQSSFEFDKNTKEVSRRHAVIEPGPDGLLVRDLNSKAGTYLNKQRLSPGVAAPVKRGDVLSFGNAGADYILE